MMPGWLTSPEWENVVKALLHTLWQGAVIAALLGLALRRVTNPAVRYRCALGALVAVMMGGLVTWAALCRPLPQTNTPASSALAPPLMATPAVVVSKLPPLIVTASLPESKSIKSNWTSWLALLWLAGATLMLARGGIQIAGAERLRRSSRPLDDRRLTALLAEARNAIGLARRVRLAVSERLTSPVVAGVLVPTLILPVSLATSLAPEQIRFILLHELAHIRRGDYLANLFQLFAEALLFFNPAVWWISRQVRLEREACCDALAVQLSGAPADYARTLVQVVEQALSPAPAAAPAFGGQREPSSLTDRVQRMLVPGYRPSLKLTWRAMIAALLTGGILLFASAIGTRVTIAAILSPQQRMDRIEKKMAEYGQNPRATGYTGNPEQAPEVKIAGHIRMADGSPVPKWISLRIHSTVPHSSYGMATMAKDGTFSETIRAGTITIGAETAGFAPAILGPLDGFATNRFKNLEIVMERGYQAHLQIMDADSGTPLTNGTMSTQFWTSGQGFEAHLATPGPDGFILLEHCTDLPLNVTLNVPGYEIVQRHFDHVLTSEPLHIALRHGETVSGTVVDLAGQPVADAELHLMYQVGGDNGGRFDWKDNLHRLGRTDASGVFRLNQLQPGLRYYLGVSAPGHESVILPPMSAGASNLVVHLGPELIVRGQITGNLEELRLYGPDRVLDINSSEVYGNDTYGDSLIVPIHRTNGAVTFLFTNRTAGHITLTAGQHHEERDITAPVENWAINLTAEPTSKAEPPVKRVVIFHFTHPSPVSPRGSVEVIVPASSPGTMMSQEISVTNDNLHLELPVGFQTQINPGHMVGYWFADNQHFITVAAGTGPQVIEIPLLPAGAIYARARNVDGTPAGGLLFGVSELKRAPGRRDMDLLDTDSDSLSDDSPRKWASGPLPLGGTYQIHAWRGNAFCVSEPIKLTESNPDAEIELQFPREKNFDGIVLDADGRLVHDAEVKPMFALSDSHSFGLKSVFTDEHGRFQLENTTPDAGAYSVEIDAPGLASESTTLNYKSQPQSVRLKRGRILAGRVVETGTGLAIPGIEVRAWSMNPSLPAQTTHTDADGHFEFNTLGNGEYSFNLDGAQRLSDPKYRADGTTNLILEVKLYPWSKAKPKMAGAQSGAIEPAPAQSSAPAPKAFASASSSPNTNAPQILITAQVYRMPDWNFETMVSRLHFNEGYRSDESRWSVSPDEFANLQAMDLQNQNIQLLAQPRGLTSIGNATRFLIDNGSNSISLNCTPGIHYGLVNLEIAGQIINGDAGNHLTNQYHTKVSTEDFGGVILRLEGTKESSLVGIIGVVVFKNHSADNLAQEGKALYETRQYNEATVKLEAALAYDPHNAKAWHYLDQISGERLKLQADFESSRFPQIEAELNNIRIPSIHFDQSSLGQVLSELMRATDGNGGRRNGSVGLTFGLESLALTNVIVSLPTLTDRTLGEVLQAVVSGANQSIQYSIQGTGVVFSTPSRLHARSFHVDLNTLYRDIDSIESKMAPTAPTDQGNFPDSTSGLVTSTTRTVAPVPSVMARSFFTNLGLDFKDSTGKAIFYNERLGLLLVKATDRDLNTIKRALTALNQPTDGNAIAKDRSKPGPEGITVKLDRIRIPEVTFDASNLRDVAKWLTQASQQNDPNGTGVNFSVATNSSAGDADTSSVKIKIPAVTDVRLADLLDAVVLVADRPIKYDILDDRIEFRPKPQDKSPQLFMRTFRVDPSTLRNGLENVTAATGQSTNASPSAVARAFFSQLGVNLESPSGKSVFYNDRLGYVFVKATEDDLDFIERALQVLNQAPPQVHLKAHICEMPPDAVSEFVSNIRTTNAAAAKKLTGILTDPNFRVVLRELSSRKDVKFLAEPEVTVTSGRQTQFQGATEKEDVVNDVVVSKPSGTEPFLDVVPYVLADGYTINLALIPVETNPHPGNQPSENRAPMSAVPNLVTTLNVWDGQTAFLTGLPEQTNNKSSSVSGRQELVMFVTATIVDPAGARVHSDDQMPFALNQTPPQPPERDDHEAGFFDPVPGLRVATKGQERSQFLTRSFKVDRNTLYRGLRQAGDWGIDAPPPDPSVETMPNAGAADPTTSALVRRFLGQLGVDLNNPPGKAVSFDPTVGYLRVRATEDDLDTIQQAIQAANPANLTVYITTRFIAIPKPSYFRALSLLNTTNPGNATPLAILSRKDARTALQELQSLKGVKTICTSDVTVTSGDLTEIPGIPIPTSFGSEFKPVLEAIPYAQADGYRIKLALIPLWLAEAGGNGQLPPFAATSGTNAVRPPTIVDKPPAHHIVTAPNIWDGQTVVLGGAERHATPEGEDVLVFITPVLVDRSGIPVNSTADLLDLPPLPKQHY